MTTETSTTDVAKKLAKLAELEGQHKAISLKLSLKLIQYFAMKLGKTKDRQTPFNTKGALMREPVIYQEVLAQGLINPEEDTFTLLQGDIVTTDAAYFMGERIIGTKFVVATSTCDLVQGRRRYAALLRIQQLKTGDANAKNLLSELLKFNSTQRMYLPPLPGDEPSTVIGNAVVFDGIVQVRLEDLLIATRHASLSLVGWRIFGSLVRTIMVRAGESEVKMRSSL